MDGQKEEKGQMKTYISKRIHRRAKAAAALQGRSLSNLVESLLRAWLAQTKRL